MSRTASGFLLCGVSPGRHWSDVGGGMGRLIVRCGAGYSGFLWGGQVCGRRKFTKLCEQDDARMSRAFAGVRCFLSGGVLSQRCRQGAGRPIVQCCAGHGEFLRVEQVCGKGKFAKLRERDDAWMSRPASGARTVLIGVVLCCFVWTRHPVPSRTGTNTGPISGRRLVPNRAGQAANKPTCAAVTAPVTRAGAR